MGLVLMINAVKAVNVMKAVHMAFLWVVSLGLVGLATAYVFFQWKYRYWKKQDIRCTNPRFPLGDVQEIAFSKHLGVVFKEIYDKFPGERFNGMWVIHRPFIMIRDPDLIKAMFVRDFMHFHDRGVYLDENRDPLSGNLFFVRGSRWRSLRTKLTPNFTSGKMKMMFQVMAERSQRLKEVLEEPALRQEAIDAKDFAVRYTSDVVSTCILGMRDDSLDNPNTVVRKMGKRVFAPKWVVIIKAAFSFLAPDLASLVKMVNTPRSVTSFFLKVIQEVMEFRESNGIKCSDLIQLLIQLKNQGFLEEADCNGNPKFEQSGKHKFTFANAVAQAFIFWIGGFETSATTMQFALYEMSKNLGIQRKARSEVRRVLAKYGGSVTYEAVHEMEYLGRVVEETLRKYPPVSILNRECSKTYRIPDSNVVIEKGIPVLISVLGIHMDPRYFPDPERFDPDRFTEEHKSSRSHYAYLPFGEGPHGCIGQRFAIMQIRVGLASLLSSFQFDLCDDTPLNLTYGRKRLIYTVEECLRLRISKLSDYKD